VSRLPPARCSNLRITNIHDIIVSIFWHPFHSCGSYQKLDLAAQKPGDESSNDDAITKTVS
jgi:hypothetical protein